MINKIILILFVSLLICCKTVQEPEPEPVPEPAPALRSFAIFNMTSNPTTGFDWEVWIDYNSTGRFALNNIQREELYPGAMGSPQRQTVTLRSSRAGRVFVHFIYKRPWESLQGSDGQEIGRYIFTFEIADDLTIRHLETQRRINRGYTEDSLPLVEDPEIQLR